MSRPVFGESLERIGQVVELLQLSAVGAAEEIAPLIHPRMRMLAAPGIAPAGSYETREDFLQYFAEAQAEGVLVEPDADEIRINSVGAITVTGRLRVHTAQGVDETPAWFVYTFRDRLIASLETHLDAEIAAEAASQAH